MENPTLRSLPGTPDMQKRLQKYCQPCETQPLLHHYKLTETPSNPGSYPYIRLPTQSASVQTSAEFEAESQVKIEQNNNAEMVELNPQQKMNFEKSNLVKPQEISSDLETRSAPCEPESSSISSYGSVKAMRHALSSLSAETGLTVMEIERKISSSSSSDEKKNVAKTKPHSDRKIVSRKKKVRKSGNTQTFVKNREPKNDKNGKECVSRDNSLDFVWNKVETEMEQSKVHPKKATLRIVATEDGNFHAVNKISQVRR